MFPPLQPIILIFLFVCLFVWVFFYLFQPLQVCMSLAHLGLLFSLLLLHTFTIVKRKRMFVSETSAHSYVNLDLLHSSMQLVYFEAFFVLFFVRKCVKLWWQGVCVGLSRTILGYKIPTFSKWVMMLMWMMYTTQHNTTQHNNQHV